MYLALIGLGVIFNLVNSIVSRFITAVLPLRSSLPLMTDFSVSSNAEAIFVVEVDEDSSQDIDIAMNLLMKSINYSVGGVLSALW